MICLVDADLVAKIKHSWIDANGYPTMSTGKQTQKSVHRFVVEQALGRKLKRTEVVHHIDGNKLNNKRNNLVVCTDKYHKLLHARQDVLADGYHPDKHHYCTACKMYHIHEDFPKNKNSWNGLHNMCKTTTNAARRGMGYSKFEWRDSMNQQYRRANQKGLVSSLTKEGRRL